jgi:hypothetical protein
MEELRSDLCGSSVETEENDWAQMANDSHEGQDYDDEEATQELSLMAEGYDNMSLFDAVTAVGGNEPMSGTGDKTATVTAETSTPATAASTAISAPAEPTPRPPPLWWVPTVKEVLLPKLSDLETLLHWQKMRVVSCCSGLLSEAIVLKAGRSTSQN